MDPSVPCSATLCTSAWESVSLISVSLTSRCLQSCSLCPFRQSSKPRGSLNIVKMCNIDLRSGINKNKISYPEPLFDLIYNPSCCIPENKFFFSPESLGQFRLPWLGECAVNLTWQSYASLLRCRLHCANRGYFQESVCRIAARAQKLDPSSHALPFSPCMQCSW